MSLSNSRRSSKMREDGEFYLECKAAYLTEFDDINDKIESKSMLISLLQTTGRNPTKTTLNKYWTSNTNSLSFNDFVDICNKEPVTTADDLMKAFRKIDINGDGYISLDELFKIMTKKEKDMTREDVRKMIDEVDDNKDGKLDYREFTNMVMKTTEDSKKMSKKVMERKERKKKRGELSAAQSNIGNNSDPINTNPSMKTGSQISLQSNKKGSDKEESDHTGLESDTKVDNTDNIGSSASLRSSKRGTKASAKDSNNSDYQGSMVSLQKSESDRIHGSRASLRSETKTQDDVKASRTSLNEDADVVVRSRTSLRSVVKESKTPEKGAYQGSQVSLASIKKESFDAENVTETPKRKESISSQRSHTSKQEDNQISETPKRKESISSQRSHNSKQEDNQSSLKPKTQGNTAVRSSTPRSKLGIPSIRELERPGTSYSNNKSTGGGILVSYTTSTKSDSARSVGEEIAFDDDADIVSTGRPTPRVSLSSRTETPKTDTARNAKAESSSTIKDVGNKDGKGKLLDNATSEGRVSKTYEDTRDEVGVGNTGTDSNKEKTGDKERLDGTREETMVKEKGAEIKGEDTKPKDVDPKSKDKDKDKTVGKQQKVEDDAESMKPADVSKGQTEKKPPSGRESSSTVKVEEDRMNESKTTRSIRPNDNDVGSQSSLKSGDKEGGVPVPSPRKSVTRGLEDDVPRPSPRVRSSKVKSPSSSVRSKERLPDPGSLRDWSLFTSKGSFFYEEDEIVSHVYNLKLFDDSTVYLSASPIADEPKSLNLPGAEPIDTALYVFDSRGNVVTFTEQRDVEGTYGVKLELSAGDYQILPYTTGCRFKQRGEASGNMKESKLVKKDKDGKIVITTAFRNALEDIFTLCDLDDNKLMSKEEFNWFNVRTSGEELGDDEWAVVEDKIDLEDGQIRMEGFIELNEMEAEDAEGDVEDLWITLTSMGMNKSLIMDEACPYRLNVYVKEVGRKKPRLSVTGIESLEKREFVTAICQSLIEKSGDPTSIRNMKDLYLYTYKNDYRATMVIDNRSRSTVRLEIDCTKSRNVVSNRSVLDHTFEIDPQQTAIAHHLMPQSEVKDWSVVSSESIHK